jgi:type IV pilus assembly protein PilC
MAQFRYTARDQHGREVSGTATEESAGALSDRLASRGYTVTVIEEYRPQRVRPVSPLRALRGRISAYALAPFFRSFHVLYRAGVPLNAALESLARQARGLRLKRAVTTMRKDVAEGMSLTDSMSRHAPAFSPLELSMVRAGEEGGFLERSLEQIADYLDEEIELRRLMVQALAYPVILLFVAVMFPIVLRYIAGAWLGLKIELWGPLNNNLFWISVAIGLVALIVLFRLGMQSGHFRLGWDHVRLHVPFVGKTLHMLIMAKFGRALAALYRGGLPLGKSLRLSGDVCGSELVRSRCWSAAVRIESGAAVADTLAGTGVFNPMVIDMLRTGESSGELDEMLLRVASYLEEDAKVRTRLAGIVFAVLVFLLIAIYIAFFVISFYSGYFSGIMSGVE